ncbi:hypothetical protein Pcinc_034974 [Petrolisthes cinctipes]|uniref:Uncharacterized protein n=1 Tax=Petrolisthes cinctipes TaxID=88211 RepID=A0AAE1BXG1_PETCI|nr:hypothetical protein Pcinc_034974 [Petrolisthes cinctipes]
MVARKPIRVHLPVADKVQQTEQYYDEMLRNSKKTTVIKPERKVHPEKDEINERQTIKTKVEVDMKHDIQHQMLEDAKHHIRTLLHNVSSRKFREKNELFVAEGERIVKESLNAGAQPEAIFFTRLSQLVRLTGSEANFGVDELCTLNSLPLYRAPYKTLQMWSALTTSPGIVGVFKIPTTPVSEPQTRLPVSLVLDEIREPANLGGILRTAAAAGANNVILMKGCCDPWERKVVRAGCGAHFRLKFTVKATWDSLSNHLPENMQLLVADMCHNNDYETETDEMKSSVNSISKTHQNESKCINSEEEFDSVYEVDRPVMTNSTNGDVPGGGGGGGKKRAKNPNGRPRRDIEQDGHTELRMMEDC